MRFLKDLIRELVKCFQKQDFTKKVALPGDDTKSASKVPWMALAKKEIGQKEVPGRGNNSRIVEYSRYVDLQVSSDSVPWCASFVNFVLVRAGYEGTNSAAARSFIDWGRTIEMPVYGCIVVFERGNSNWKGHVGFFVGFHQGDLLILGGNQSDAVNIKKYPRSKVLAYRMPE